ncbi:hypothetical protein LWM68_35570 [Niabella sp. W65]|nr:hypothetical protein [Niabella sp. W65]MCH7367614.1 hypothetical protein [Niabella sp. W65]
MVLRLHLENGVIGESYLLSFQYSPNAILGALKDALPHIVGLEAFETGKAEAMLYHNSSISGPAALTNGRPRQLTLLCGIHGPGRSNNLYGNCGGA